MEICQVLLSLIHAWGVDADVDRLCETKLGMLRPKQPVCFGLISKHGQSRSVVALGDTLISSSYDKKISVLLIS